MDNSNYIDYTSTQFTRKSETVMNPDRMQLTHVVGENLITETGEAKANVVEHRCFGDKGDVEDITEGENQNSIGNGINPTPPPLSDQLTVSPPNPADIISTVEFDHTGNYLATGDKGGRVVLFERNETVCALLEVPSAPSMVC